MTPTHGPKLTSQNCHRAGAQPNATAKVRRHACAVGGSRASKMSRGSTIPVFLLAIVRKRAQNASQLA